MKLSGAEILIECLLEQGVDTLFGFPGGAVLPIYDALYTRGGSIRHIFAALFFMRAWRPWQSTPERRPPGRRDTTDTV